MKKALSLLLSVLLLLSLAPAAFAETEPAAIADAEPAASDETEPVILDAYLAWLDPVSKSVSFQLEDEGYYRLMDAEGKIVVTEEEEYIDMLPWDGFFLVEKESEDTLPCKGILAPDGTVIVPARYDDVDILNEHWQVGVVLGPGTEEDWEYAFTDPETGKETYYKVASNDFYFDGELVGSLDSAVCNGSSMAFGAYLVCYGNDGETTFYNSKLEPSPYETKYTDEYDWDFDAANNEIYIHQGSGQIAFQPDCTLKPEDVEVPYLYKAGKLYDLQGKEVASYPREYDFVHTFPTGFGISQLDGKYGLVTLDGKELIPPEYDQIGYYEDLILSCGAVSAVKGGKVGFFDAEGKLTCDFLYPEDDIEVFGNFARIENEDGSYTVISGLAGELPEHYRSVLFTDSNGSMTFSAEKADGTAGVVDVQGNILLPFSKDYAFYDIELSLDGTTALVYQDGHYVIYHF